MTEQRWLRGKLWNNLAQAMLAVVSGSASRRKLRLALCGVTRRSVSFDWAGVRESTELAEKWADGEVTDKEAAKCYRARRWTVLEKSPTEALELHFRGPGGLVAPDVFREVFGNPFRPVTLNPAWLSSDVVALAEGIYADRAFDRMPILADALQDAGCEHPGVLAHCRDTKLTHVRGCWVIDLVLGKE